jgi:predicted nucleotidyltransferase
MKRVNSKREVLRRVDANRERLAQMGVARLGLFGSFARNEQGRNSDVDLLVEFAPGQKNFDNFMALGFFLEEVLDRRVELVTPESLSPHIRPHIMSQVEYVVILPEDVRGMPVSQPQEAVSSEVRLGDFLLNSPLRDSELVIERIRDTCLREVDLYR